MKQRLNPASCKNLQLAFFVPIVLLLASCAVNNIKTSDLSPQLCQPDVTSIAAIQGSGKTSPLLGQQVTVRGIVTQIQAQSGLFIEQIMADMDPASSDGLFIKLAEIPTDIASGDLLQLSGIVTEYQPAAQRNSGGVTALENITIEGFCGHHQPLPAHAIQLPLSPAERESLEAMRLTIDQELTVTDVYRLAKHQQIGAASGGLLMTPSEITKPGDSISKVGINNSYRLINIQLPTLDDNNHQINEKIYSLSGILSQNNGYYNLLANAKPESTPYQPAPLPAKGQTLRVMGFNLHNYFNGNGDGSGFPTERGAKTYPEFIQQRARLVNAVSAAQADILAVEELENDGYGPASAIVDLQKALNQSMPAADWRFARPLTDRIGGDLIGVGILYRGSRVSARGPAISTTAAAFEARNRKPLAQRFKDKQSGQELILVINHLKSKGRCPKLDPGADAKQFPDANQHDGQACWNATRTQAASALADWLNNLHNISGLDNILILGDFNSYRLEDPITTLQNRGWTELVAAHQEKTPFSYIYRGQAGTLDYAFASQGLKDQIKRALIWNINSVFSPETTYREGSYFRSSDHDPVLVDIISTP